MPAGLERRVFYFFFHCDIVSIIVHGGAQPEPTQTVNKILSMCAHYILDLSPFRAWFCGPNWNFKVIPDVSSASEGMLGFATKLYHRLYDRGAYRYYGWSLSSKKKKKYTPESCLLLRQAPVSETIPASFSSPFGKSCCHGSLFSWTIRDPQKSSHLFGSFSWIGMYLFLFYAWKSHISAV